MWTIVLSTETYNSLVHMQGFGPFTTPNEVTQKLREIGAPYACRVSEWTANNDRVIRQTTGDQWLGKAQP